MPYLNLQLAVSTTDHQSNVVLNLLRPWPSYFTRFLSPKTKGLLTFPGDLIWLYSTFGYTTTNPVQNFIPCTGLFGHSAVITSQLRSVKLSCICILCRFYL